MKDELTMNREIFRTLQQQQLNTEKQERGEDRSEVVRALSRPHQIIRVRAGARGGCHYPVVRGAKEEGQDHRF
ncbi:hypothetical protein Pmani_012829 [Petrolisthes manimaculis]|uniref:Uncharacterized protein n=1 Tax=Petrolisthes manimaculis TaxID=1843537 RepID=A0AAE1UCU1_9EUCA|nr:hypothetical protein Pmani_012829 [Petrolisthes manimaculis]